MSRSTIDDDTLAAIRFRAVELASQAPPLTSAQIDRLRTIFGTSGSTGTVVDG